MAVSLIAHMVSSFSCRIIFAGGHLRFKRSPNNEHACFRQEQSPLVN